MTIERVIELLSRDYWFEDAELKEAKRIAVEILAKVVDGDRPYWCPLIAVPTPHGRLIDAENLHDCAADMYGGNGDNTLIWYGDLLGMVDDCPTVIEAED